MLKFLITVKDKILRKSHDQVHLKLYYRRHDGLNSLWLERYLDYFLNAEAWDWTAGIDACDHRYFGKMAEEHEVELWINSLYAIKGNHKFELSLDITKTIVI